MKLASKYFLLSQTVAKTQAVAKPVDVPTNHVCVIDCSGSMSWDLPKIREHLKRRIRTLFGQKDTLSIIWFSGRGQFGTLLEAEPVATLTDLKAVEASIDRWLKPIGLTGFKEPLEEAAKLVQRVAKKDGVYSLFFLSDGCDNAWQHSEILQAIEKAAGLFNSATIVEYGYYADRRLLTQMAEKFGGVHVFSEDFPRFEPSFDAAMKRQTSNAPKVEVFVGAVINDFAFALVGDDLLTFSVEQGRVFVPEMVDKVWYVATSGKEVAKDEAALYATMSLFAQRVNSDVVWEALKATGDVRFINQFSTCFGKQNFSTFVDDTKAAAFNAQLRLSDGQDFNLVPADDAFTIFDLLETLQANPENLLLLHSKDFKYTKIGRSVVDADETLTKEEQAQVEAITAKMASVSRDAKKLAALQAEITAITVNKPKALKFTEEANPKGVPVQALVFNKERPNISVQTQRFGTVNLSERLPKEAPWVSKVPVDFPTSIFRNYTIVKDGIINVKQLPLRLTGATVRKLVEQGMPFKAILGCDGESAEVARTRVKKAAQEREVPVLIDLTLIPVLNRKMVSTVSAREAFESEVALLELQAAKKVFDNAFKERFPYVSEGFVQRYGDEATKWLDEVGLTDKGFNPRVLQAEATDFYMAKELAITVKGYSKLPSVNEVRGKMAPPAPGKKAAKPLSGPTALMAKYLTELDGYLTGDEYTRTASDKDKDAKLKAWLEAKTRLSIEQVRDFQRQKAMRLFSIIVGQTWFKEFSTLDDNTLKVTVSGADYDCTAELSEKKTLI
jgi:hypothetical protein